MTGFVETMRLKGKADEDRYFANLNQERIAVLHAKNIEALSQKCFREARRQLCDRGVKLANIQ